MFGLDTGTVNMPMVLLGSGIAIAVFVLFFQNKRKLELAKATTLFYFATDRRLEIVVAEDFNGWMQTKHGGYVSNPEAAVRYVHGRVWRRPKDAAEEIALRKTEPIFVVRDLDPAPMDFRQEKAEKGWVGDQVKPERFNTLRDLNARMAADQGVHEKPATDTMILRLSIVTGIVVLAAVAMWGALFVRGLV